MQYVRLLPPVPVVLATALPVWRTGTAAARSDGVARRLGKGVNVLRTMKEGRRSFSVVAAALVAVAVLVLLNGGRSPSAVAFGPDILVHDGNGALDQGYTAFGNAAGRRVLKTVQDFPGVDLPADLSQFFCIVLPVNNNAFTDAQKTALVNYVRAGGRLLALGENETVHQGHFPNFNGLATALGSGLSIVPDIIDDGLGIFADTPNIDPSPFTAGVSSIRYGATSQVLVNVEENAGAHSLLRTRSPHHHAVGSLVEVHPDHTHMFMAAAPIGSGWLFLSGDSNAFSDANNNAYVFADNGVLVFNMCGQPGPTPTAAPVGGIVEVLGDPEPAADRSSNPSSREYAAPLAAAGAAAAVAVTVTACAWYVRRRWLR